MKKISGYENVQATGDTQRPGAGGYVVVITSVEDNPDREYLCVEFDIAEGPFAGYCSETFGRFGNWPALGKTYRSYKEKALGMFKSFTKAIEDSPENAGYAWDWNEQELVGKQFGAVLGIEEYEGNDGSVREGLKLARCVPTGKIRSGEFRIPEPKRLERGGGSFTDLGNVSVPFEL